MKAVAPVGTSVSFRNVSLVAKEALPASIGKDAVYRFVDNLLVGPSRYDLERQVDVRAGYFGGEQSAWRDVYDVLGSASDTRPVCIWGVESWASRLALAFVCAHRRQHSLASDIKVVDLPSQGLIRGVCCSVPMNASSEGSSRMLASKEVEDGAAFWRMYVSEDPRTILGASTSWKLFPQRKNFVSFVRAHFPRGSPGNSQLSELDVSLLSATANASVRVVDILTASSLSSRRARQWAHCTGDLTLARRLADWSEYPIGDPALSIDRDETSPLLWSRYRLTARGRSLLGGLSDLREAPPCVLGGTRAYDVERPFFVSVD